MTTEKKPKKMGWCLQQLTAPEMPKHYTQGRKQEKLGISNQKTIRRL